MLTLRPATERGHADHGWLKTWHTFSFADYFDPKHVHFRSLRVINEDFVAPGQGFGAHPHNDMEIVTWVLEGALEHRDSLGGHGVIRPGDAQRITAGTGVLHSEFNHSKSELVHLLQIWMFPEARGLQPGYEQKHFPLDGRRGRLQLIAARDGRDGAVSIHQDVDLYASVLDEGATLEHPLREGRGAWLQVASGSVTVNGKPLGPGDAVGVEDEAVLKITATSPAEFLLFDLA